MGKGKRDDSWPGPFIRHWGVLRNGEAGLMGPRSQVGGVVGSHPLYVISQANGAESRGRGGLCSRRCFIPVRLGPSKENRHRGQLRAEEGSFQRLGALSPEAAACKSKAKLGLVGGPGTRPSSAPRSSWPQFHKVSEREIADQQTPPPRPGKSQTRFLGPEPCGRTSQFRSDFIVNSERKLRELASLRNRQKVLPSAGRNTAAPLLRHTLSALPSAPRVPDPSLSPSGSPSLFAAPSRGWAPPDFTQVKPATALLGASTVHRRPLASDPGASLSVLSCGPCGTPLSTHTCTT